MGFRCTRPPGPAGSSPSSLPHPPQRLPQTFSLVTSLFPSSSHDSADDFSFFLGKKFPRNLPALHSKVSTCLPSPLASPPGLQTSPTSIYLPAPPNLPPSFQPLTLQTLPEAFKQPPAFCIQRKPSLGPEPPAISSPWGYSAGYLQARKFSCLRSSWKNHVPGLSFLAVGSQDASQNWLYSGRRGQSGWESVVRVAQAVQPLQQPLGLRDSILALVYFW